MPFYSSWYFKLLLCCVVSLAIVEILINHNQWGSVIIENSHEQIASVNPTGANQATDSAKLYSPIGDTWLVNNSDICARYGAKRPIELLLLVSSAGGHGALRSAIRSTWKKELERRQVLVVFFVGRPQADEQLDVVRQESDEHGDIVLHPFSDDYRALVYGTLAMFEWTLRFCAPAHFRQRLVAKSDDDVWIDARRYVPAMLQPRSLSAAVVGCFHSEVQVIRDSQHRWFVSYNDYAPHTWPTYAGGFHYALSADLLAPMYEVALTTPLVPIEDVFVTGLLANAVQAQHIDLGAKFAFKKPAFDATSRLPFRGFLVVHKVSPDEIRTAYAAYLSAADSRCPLHTLTLFSTGLPLLWWNYSYR